MAPQKLTGGQMIVDLLIREGVEKVFAIPGHGNTALLDAFVDRKDEIELVPAMHEQGAAHMADGYYRSSGKIAAVCTSIGPGATNTLTGVATAFADSQPLILITGVIVSEGRPCTQYALSCLAEINRNMMIMMLLLAHVLLARLMETITDS